MGLKAPCVWLRRNSPSTMREGSELRVPRGGTAKFHLTTSLWWHPFSASLHTSLSLQLARACTRSPAGQTCTCECVCPNRNVGLAECVCARAGRRDIDLSLCAHTVCPQAAGQCPRQSGPFTIITVCRPHEQNAERGCGRAPCTVVSKWLP